MDQVEFADSIGWMEHALAGAEKNHQWCQGPWS